MKLPSNIISILYPVAGILSVYLFNGEAAGLNILLFSFVLFIVFLYSLSNKPEQDNFTFRTVLLVYIISLFGVIFVNSVFAITMHLIAFLLLCGLSVPGNFRSLLYVLMSTLERFQKLFQRENMISLPGRRKNSFSILLIPILICSLFVWMYSLAVPSFSTALRDFFETFRSITIEKTLLFIGGIFLALLLLKPAKGIFYFAESDKNASDIVRREKSPEYGKQHKTLQPALRNEFTSSAITLGMLIAIGSIVIVFDIREFWSGFDNFTYEKMKMTVHVGSYVLIFSILLSIGIALHIFRKSLNFYPKVKLLRNLTLTWLLCNVVLVTSVIIKNIWYIHYFNLAYKRIGLFIFLAAVIFGIATVLIKIYKKRSGYFIVRCNMSFICILLCLASCFNWDRIIAEYNLARPQAYIHKLYLSSLDESALVVLKKYPKLFDEKITHEPGYRKIFDLPGIDSTSTYNDVIQARLRLWKTKDSALTWKSWNFKRYSLQKETDESTFISRK